MPWSPCSSGQSTPATPHLPCLCHSAPRVLLNHHSKKHIEWHVACRGQRVRHERKNGCAAKQSLHFVEACLPVPPGRLKICYLHPIWVAIPRTCCKCVCRHFLQERFSSSAHKEDESTEAGKALHSECSTQHLRLAGTDLAPLFWYAIPRNGRQRYVAQKSREL